MASNIVKAGYFTDGGCRLVAVKPGNNADPLPTDPTKIIFNSDVGELFPTRPGLYGVATSISTSSSWQTIATFPSLGFTPFALAAYRPRTFSTGAGSGPWQNTSTWYPVNVIPTSIAGASSLYPQGIVTYLGVACSPTSLSINFNPNGTDVSYDYPTSIDLAWAIILQPNNLTSLPSASARVGAGEWMRMSTNGLSIAKPGKSVTSPNIQDFLVSDQLLNLTVNAVGRNISYATWVGGSTNAWEDTPYTYTHNLGYIPFFWANFDNQNLSTPPGSISVTTTTITFHAQFYLENSASYQVPPGRFVLFDQQWA